MTDDPLNPADTLRRITGAWVIPHNLARIAGWVNTNRDAINAIMVEATRQPTIGERLYPISAGPVRTLVPLNIPFEHLIPAEMQFPRHLPPMPPLNCAVGPGWGRPASA